MINTVAVEHGMEDRQYDIIKSAKKNDLEGVMAAIRHDPHSVNEQHPKYRFTAVHVAAGGGLDDILDFLLTCEHIDLSIRDISGNTAIDNAILNGFHRFTERLYRVAYPKLMAGDDDGSDPFPPQNKSGPKPTP